LPLWSSAHVGNMPLHEFHPAGHLMLTVRDRAEIIANVRDAAAQIIEAKGATNWAIGLAVVRIVDAILRNENAVLTVSRLLENYRGISDVCLSVPCLVNRNGVGEPLPVEMSEDEVKGLQASAEVLKTACRQVGLS
jgi:L-lactate dehydrogenase